MSEFLNNKSEVEGRKVTLNGEEMSLNTDGEYQSTRKVRTGFLENTSVCLIILGICLLMFGPYNVGLERVETEYALDTRSIEGDIDSNRDPGEDSYTDSRKSYTDAELEQAREISSQPYFSKGDMQKEEDWENSHTVTVHCIDLAGTSLRNPIEWTFNPGDVFQIKSPLIEGYAPVLDSVSGAVGGRDLPYYMYYIPVE